MTALRPTPPHRAPQARLPARTEVWPVGTGSVGGNAAGATRHGPRRALTDGRPSSFGVQGGSARRNAPRVLIARYIASELWDGRGKAAGHRAAPRIANPVAMGQPDLEA